MRKQGYEILAFPGEMSDGMTLLDWFAGQALCSMDAEKCRLYSKMVAEAYDIAEAMMVERTARAAERMTDGAE